MICWCWRCWMWQQHVTSGLWPRKHHNCLSPTNWLMKPLQMMNSLVSMTMLDWCWFFFSITTSSAWEAAHHDCPGLAASRSVWGTEFAKTTPAREQWALLKPSEAAPGSRDNGACADDSRLVKASQAEAGPGASAPPLLEPPEAAAADEKCSLLARIRMLVRSIIAFGSRGNFSFELGYPGLSQVILLTCAGISRHIPSCTELSPREISQDIPGYPKTRFLSWDIPLQVFCFG